MGIHLDRLRARGFFDIDKTEVPKVSKAQGEGPLDTFDTSFPANPNKFEAYRALLRNPAGWGAWTMPPLPPFLFGEMEHGHAWEVWWGAVARQRTRVIEKR